MIEIQTCRSLYSKQFFRLSLNLTGKWNLDIDFFQVLTYCNFFNYSFIEKCYYFSITSYRVYDLQTDNFVKTVFFTQKVSKREDLMKISKLIFSKLANLIDFRFLHVYVTYIKFYFQNLGNCIEVKNWRR